MNALVSHAAVFDPVVVDRALIRKHGGNGPRYTSYPTADRFVEAFDEKAYRHFLGRRQSAGPAARSLGLYVHVPFCDTLCFYCACNKIAARDRAKGKRYVDALLAETKLVAHALGGSRKVDRMHWGGGTPTFLREDDCERLVRALRDAFEFDPHGEYAIEIDPRKADAARIAHLAALGFNRLSIGVQDFDPAVQKAVNRIQSLAQTREVIDAGRANGFRSINLDLIFGLPRQTLEGFAATLERVIECDPDRVALYSYAHLPSAFSPQRRIAAADLPAPEVKLELMTMAIARLGDAGYAYIGMDHFAKPGDDLAVAQRQGRLTRDFQGYSAGHEGDLIGLGVSSIGRMGPTYVQNVKDLETYYERLAEGSLPVLRGIELTADDMARRSVIQALACRFAVSKEAIGIANLIDFDAYFAEELRDLAGLAADGLVELDDEWVRVTERGRLLVRSICMVFDRYVRRAEQRAQYSRVM